LALPVIGAWHISCPIEGTQWVTSHPLTNVPMTFICLFIEILLHFTDDKGTVITTVEFKKKRQVPPR
jgi:hypothetical protein